MSSEYNKTTKDTIVHEKISAQAGTYTGSLLQNIASNHDLKAARQQNLLKSKSANSKKDLLSSNYSKMTASKWVLEGHSHHLGLSLVEEVQRAMKVKAERDEAKAKSQRDIMRKIHYDADAVRAKHDNQMNDVSKWTAKDITTVLKSYRMKVDAAIPTKKAELVNLFQQWKNRTITNYNGKVEVDLTIVDDSNEESEMEKTTGGQDCNENVTHAELVPDVNQNSFEVSSEKVAI